MQSDRPAGACERDDEAVEVEDCRLGCVGRNRRREAKDRVTRDRLRVTGFGSCWNLGECRLVDLGASQRIGFDVAIADCVVLQLPWADRPRRQLGSRNRSLFQLLRTDAVPGELDGRIARAAERDDERYSCHHHRRRR